jgi:hypothetical protein
MKNRIFPLSNGLRIANFSSPHPFLFTDGTIIPAVEDKLAKLTMLDVEEQRVSNYTARRFQTVKLSWSLSEMVDDQIALWYTIYQVKEVDVVLVPMPVMIALKNTWTEKMILKSPFRVIRMADRITKAIHIDKFCI